jgi:hypothetical protein
MAITVEKNPLRVLFCQSSLYLLYMANIKYKYTKEILEDAARKSKSYADVIRCLGMKMAGGNHAHIKRQIKKFGIDISHFQDKLYAFKNAARKKAFASRKTYDEVFNLSPEYRLKGKMLTRALIESGTEYKCVKCDVKNTYNGLPITLEVDHVDENWRNNKKENLQFLCPNCHSQRK